MFAPPDAGVKTWVHIASISDFARPDGPTYTQKALIFRRFRSAPALLLLFAQACGDDPLSVLQPQIDVFPHVMDFGEGVVGAENAQSLTILNRGEGLLRIESVRVDGSNVFSTGEPPEAVQSLSESPFLLLFVPRAPKEAYEGKVVIASNDPDNPELEVPVRGVGGIREIDVFPTEIDFGVVDEGSERRLSVTISNTGGDPLEVQSITLTSTAVDLFLPTGFSSGEVLAKTSTTFQIAYSPKDLGADSGVIEIRSNDEDEPVVSVPVRAIANLAPRAIAWGCTTESGQVGCDGVERLSRLTLSTRGRMGLEGRESFDPEGTAIQSYSWQVVSRPAASNAAIFHSTEDLTVRRRATGDIEIDEPGTYDLRLIVRDERGLESLDKPESHVQVTPKDLTVLLSWDLSTDVDLHFVRPGGRPGDYGSRRVGTSTGSDCNAYNRSPNWGDESTSRDDPSLDIDFVTGVGPEEVSLDRPVAGTYAVYVHYCDGQDVGVPVNDAVVRVLVRGQEIARVPPTGMSYGLAPGELWKAAEVTWTGEPGSLAVVTDLSDELPVLRPDLCRLR